MNIVYAADDNYAPILAVSILSLCEHNKNLFILILDNGISIENRNIIERIARNKEVCLSFYQGEKIEKKFSFTLNMDRGSMAQFARLFIDDILPDMWNRVLYLDCDTLVRNSLDILYEIDMQNMVVAGVEDAFGKQHWKALELDKGDVYINSGMMLIDLTAWRKQKIEKQFAEFIFQKKGKILQGDQGIINAVLKSKILKLPIQYNMVTYIFDFTYKELMLYRKPYEFYLETEINKAKESPVIVHFTSSFASMRPWENTNVKHMYVNEWLGYYEELGYSIKSKDKLSRRIYEKVPHLMALFFIGILHAYIKPSIYLAKKKDNMY